MATDDAATAGTSTDAPGCGATCGVTRERERQKATARALAARAYPGELWSPARAWAPEEPPVPPDEVLELARALEDVLPARALVAPPGAGECDAVYLYAGMPAPCWLEAREREVATVAPEAARETYLRVAFSPLGRYFTLQEVHVEATREDGDALGAWVEERRCVGVVDRRLQLFVKAAQGLLRKRRVTGLDAAFLATPVPDPRGEVSAQLGAPPTLYTLLFERVPAGSVRGEYVPLAPR